MAWTLKILEYQSTEAAEAGTNTTTINITGHGLSAEDFIVNTTRRTYSMERGSRYVKSKTSNSLTVDAITGQTSGDSIRLYKYVDRTDTLFVGSLRVNIKQGGNSEMSFTMITTAAYLPSVGQYIKLFDGSTCKFAGVIRSARRKVMSENSTTLTIDVQCTGLNTIAGRRTIQVDYAAGTTADDIVTEMITDYLCQEGIRAGTIDTGCELQEQWTSDAISIQEVLDTLATKSAYQWFINSSLQLNFYQDPAVISAAAHALVDGNAYENYSKVEIEDTIDEYTNKCFVAGGYDANGNPVMIYAHTESEMDAQQERCGGSGVYGVINRDSAVDESSYHDAEVGTSTTNIKVTDHAQEEGYLVWNSTRDEYRIVTAVVDEDNITVATVTGQVATDVIVFFTDANKIAANALKKQGLIPAKLSFQSSDTDWEPGSKLQVELATYGVDEYFLIEEVELFDLNGNTIYANIRATRRDNTNFSTQRSNTFIEYWGGF